jgi:lysozyme
MQLSKTGYDFIKRHEGCRLEAYRDSVGIPTIGYGNTQYQDGRKVHIGDTITMEQADELFKFYADRFAVGVSDLITKPVTQNQFNALVSLAYNIGIGAFTKSTVLRLVNVDPNSDKIQAAFMMWSKGTVKGKKQVLPGLANRRKAEIILYRS